MDSHNCHSCAWLLEGLSFGRRQYHLLLPDQQMERSLCKPRTYSEELSIFKLHLGVFCFILCVFVSYFRLLFCFVLFQAFVCIWLSVGGFPLNPLHSSSFAPPPEHYFLSLLLSGPRDTASNWLFICRRMKPIWLDPTLNRNKFLRIKDFIIRAEPQKLIEEGGEHKST